VKRVHKSAVKMLIMIGCGDSIRNFGGILGNQADLLKNLWRKAEQSVVLKVNQPVPEERQIRLGK